MKKMYLVLIAAVIAIGISAFTKPEAVTTTVWYQDDDTGPWFSEDLTPCASGPETPCKITTAKGWEPIFQSEAGLPFSKETSN